MAKSNSNTPSPEQMWAVLQGIAAKLGGENVAIPAAIPAPAPAKAVAPPAVRPEPVLTFRVSQKGALSVYGLGRFPVTLYANQWEALAKAMPTLMAFVRENAASFARKG